MKPSPTSPVSFRASGPYAATHTSSSLPWLHGNWIRGPVVVLDRARVAELADDVDRLAHDASVVGLPFVTRTAESPRPMPTIVRLPYISLSVANTLAVTVQSRVAGFVTKGPTFTRSRH